MPKKKQPSQGKPWQPGAKSAPQKLFGSKNAAVVRRPPRHQGR